MGGPFNHNKGGNSSNSNSNRGRPYGLMLVMAFAAALVGVMMLHKLRERRIFNLVIKEKDTELVSLHLALQVLVLLQFTALLPTVMNLASI